MSDLPFISEHFTQPSTMRKRRLGDRLVYRYGAELSDYARKVRKWTGFKTHGAVDGHTVRITPRDFPIFQRMPHGAEYPRALQIAEQLLRENWTILHWQAASSNRRRRVMKSCDAGPFHPTIPRSFRTNGGNWTRQPHPAR